MISQEAAPWLARLARARQAPSAIAIDETIVAELETVIGSVIPHDILALIAIERRSLGALVEYTEEIRAYYNAIDRSLIADLKFAHVAFAITNDVDGDRGDAEPRYATFAITTQRDRVDLIEWTLRKPTAGSTPYSFERYMLDVHHLDASAEPGELPVITVATPVVIEEYVSHAKFGRGRVVKRGEGKVTVEFADATRTLAQAFVKLE